MHTYTHTQVLRYKYFQVGHSLTTSTASQTTTNRPPHPVAVNALEHYHPGNKPHPLTKQPIRFVEPAGEEKPAGVIKRRPTPAVQASNSMLESTSIILLNDASRVKGESKLALDKSTDSFWGILEKRNSKRAEVDGHVSNHRNQFNPVKARQSEIPARQADMPTRQLGNTEMLTRQSGQADMPARKVEMPRLRRQLSKNVARESIDIEAILYEGKQGERYVL